MPPGQLPQQPVPPVTSESNPYSFIMAPPPQPKRSLLPKVGSSKLQRVAVVAVGGMLLLVVIIMLYSLLFGAKTNTDDLVNLAARQNELIRVATLGTQTAKSETAKSLAINTELELFSDQKQTLDYLKKQGRMVSLNELSLAKNTHNDQVLSAATLNNNFDQAFMDLLQSNLTAYQVAAKKVYDASSSKTVKSILTTSYSNAALLIEVTREPL